MDGPREQYYAGRADWEIIRQGEGGRLHPGDRQRGRDAPAETAAQMFAETGCDGIMVGPGRPEAIPWIFRELVAW